MISLLSEEYDTPIQKGDSPAFRKHLLVVSWIENFLKLRDYFIIAKEPTGAPKYIADEEQRNLRFCRQFNDVSDNIEFYKKVYEKARNDHMLDYSKFEINNMFDVEQMEGSVKANGIRTVTYVHFSLKEDFSAETIETAIKTILSLQSKTIMYTNMVFLIVAPLIDVEMEPGNNYSKFNTELSKRLKLAITIMTLDRFNSKFDQFSKCYFDMSTKENNFYLINKVLRARRTIAEMVEGRGYTGTKTYLYNDDMSGRFGHYLMNLDKRLELAQRDNLPLAQTNYFDMYGLYRSTDSRVVGGVGVGVPVYIHFILLQYSDLSEYATKFEGRVREFIGLGEKDPLHLILIVNKKQTAKNMIEKIGDRPYKDDSLTIDYHLLDNLMYNPLKNINQPKFQLLKRGSAEYKEAVRHYGSTDDIPIIKARDRVNLFFGADYNDLYKIVRPIVTRVNDKTSQIHVDVAYRIVK